MKQLVVCIFIFIAVATTYAQRPIVGAIRWDAWLGEADNVGKEVNKSLSPQKWHTRVPFFTKIISTTSVDVDARAQSVSDQEIRYAAHAHLDYFAFLMYNETHSLSIGLKNYLKSTEKSKVNFSVIMNAISDEAVSYSVHRVMNYIKEPSYQKVLGNRPLVYTFQLRDDPTFAILLKDSCVKKGLPEPYIVDLHWTNAMPTSTAYDAISCYWYEGTWFGGSTTGAPYTNLMSSAQTDWLARKNAGCKQVPMVSLGADGRPRIENPVSWIPDPSSMYAKYFITPTPTEIVTHLGQAFDFIAANPLSCEANAVLMYAWNENDEGGWIIPTLNTGGDTNTTRIDAMRTFLSAFDEPPHFESIQVTPANSTVQPGTAITLVAQLLDQRSETFDTTLTIQWSISGGGTLSASTGVSVSCSTAGVADGTTMTITATAGGKTAQAIVLVQSFGKLTGTIIGSNNASNPLHGQQYAFDNDLQTYAEIDGYPRWAGLQLSGTYVISELRYYTRTYYETRMPGAQFEVSDDGINWTVVYTIASGEAKSLQWNTITLSQPVEANYVRLNQPANWLTAAEIEFWGAPKSIITDVKEQESTFKLYPNPATSQIIIKNEKLKMNNIGGNTISIHNTLGQEFYNSSFFIFNSSLHIDVSQLTPGLYFIKVGNHVQKFIKE